MYLSPQRRLMLLFAAHIFLPATVFADEGGFGFWLPGSYGSLAAVPAEPGWAFSLTYVHLDVSAKADEKFKRGKKLTVGVEGRGDLMEVGPTYTFEPQIWGGRLSLSLLASGGRAKVNASSSFANGDEKTSYFQGSSQVTAFGDLLPQATLAWNDGVHNFMTYMMGNVPVGQYDPDRIANIGIGYGAVDGGAGYTFLDPNSGYEASMVFGLTYSFENPDTHYQNGIDSHVDWGVSRFITQQVHAGVAGYYYQQLTGDSGSGATQGDFKSRIAGIGPQVGVFFPVSKGVQGYLNLKGYKEFAAQNRPDGWNMWISLSLTPGSDT